MIMTVICKEVDMDWYHEVSENWLRARKTVITATEIKGLVATYKRMSKKDKEAGVVSPAFAALWGDKSSTYPIDVSSYGPAARGHIMEPYAIDEFNRANEVHFHHWDDCIIANGLVGFSPDAMDIAQVTEDVKLGQREMPHEFDRGRMRPAREDT